MAIDRRPSTGPTTRNGLLYIYDGNDQTDDVRLADFLARFDAGESQYTRAYAPPSIQNGQPVCCDSPYGYLFGQLLASGISYEFVVVSPAEFQHIRGGGLTSDRLGEVNGQWALTSFMSVNGTALLAYQPPPPERVVPPSPGVDQPAAKTDTPDRILIKQKPILDQALDEGYNPLSKESPTGLKRPTIDSPTQVLAYLLSCSSMNKDLAINEMDAILDNRAEFFSRPWPEWATEDAKNLKEALTKVG